MSPLLKGLINKVPSIKTRKNCKAIDILIYNKNLFDKIRSLGFSVGKKGPKLTIPDYFIDKNLMKLIIAGFMATDGSLVLTKNPNKYYPRIEGNGISEKLIKQIKDYLVNIGMKSSFYLAKRKNMGSSYNIQR